MEHRYPRVQNTAPEPAKMLKHLRLRKRWVVAQSRVNEKHLQMTNELTETAYHRVLLKVKQLYSTRNETVFEKDYKHNSSECPFAMHSFICASFVFQLECYLDYTYKVLYQIQNSPFEQTIRQLLTEYPLPDRAIEMQFKPDLPTFFQAVLGFQNDHYITKL